MTMENKDFKVKNGLQVTEGGVFGGTVTVDTPTENNHAATKEYVDNAAGNPVVPTETEAPAGASDGQLYFDTTNNRLAVFYGSQWITLATLDDANDLPQHIHDTAIGGSGLITSYFISGGFYNETGGTPVDAGTYETTSWSSVYDGGIASDNFN